MKFSEKMCLKMILKVTKTQGFTLSLKDAFSEKPQWGQIDSLPLPSPLSPAALGLTYHFPDQTKYETQDKKFVCSK